MKNSTIVPLVFFITLYGCASSPGPFIERSPQSALSSCTELAGEIIQKNKNAALKTVANESSMLITENTEAWPARLAVIKEAKSSIYLSTFILEVGSDEYGNAILAELLAARLRGVDVHLNVDVSGSMEVAQESILMGTKDYLKLLSFHGVNVTLFNQKIKKINPWAMGSNHAKELIVDDLYTFIGGRNVSADYFTDEAGSYFDTDILIKSESVAQKAKDAFFQMESNPYNEIVTPLNNEFTRDRLLKKIKEDNLSLVTKDEDAIASWKGRIKKDKMSGSQNGSATVIYKSNVHADESINEIRPKMFELIDSAKDEIIIQNPYIILDDETVERLARAAKRGVKVKFFTNSIESLESSTLPEKMSSFLVQSVFESEWVHYIENIPGLEINAVKNKRPLHSKVFVFDKKTTLVTSYNLDPQAEKLNSEIGVVVESPSMAKKAKNIIEDPKTKDGAEKLEYVRYWIEEKENGDKIIHGPEQISDGAYLKSLSVKNPWYQYMIEFYKPIL